MDCSVSWHLPYKTVNLTRNARPMRQCTLPINVIHLPDNMERLKEEGRGGCAVYDG